MMEYSFAWADNGQLFLHTDGDPEFDVATTTRITTWFLHQRDQHVACSHIIVIFLRKPLTFAVSRLLRKAGR